MTKRLTDQEVKALQDKFLGKRITFKDKKGETWTGVAEFVGYNPFFPDFGFQITIGRMPIRHVDVSTIKLVINIKHF